MQPSHYHNILSIQTLTNPNGQPYLKSKLSTQPPHDRCTPPTATRTDTPLVEVPQSVQVVTQTMLKEQDSHTLADALVNVSGVRATKPQEALFAQPIVRGFPAEIYMNGLPAFGGTAASIDPTSLIGKVTIDATAK